MTIATSLQMHASSRCITVVSAGKSALNFLSNSDQWRIIAVFNRCFYCEDIAGNILCVAAPSLDKGPFTLNCDQEEFTHCPGCKEGNYLHFRDGHFYLAESHIFFNTEKVSEWHCPLFSNQTVTPKLKNDIETLGTIAVLKAPPESLGTLIPVILSANSSESPKSPHIFTAAIQKQVLDSIQSTREIMTSIGTVSAILSECTKLIGFGLGLTPSGDDFIAGIIMAFYNQGRFDEAHSLARRFYSLAIKRTASISLAFFRALADGLAVESYTKFIFSFGKGMSENSSPLNRITNFGATSGWDFLAGFAFGLTLISPVAARTRIC